MREVHSFFGSGIELFNYFAPGETFTFAADKTELDRGEIYLKPAWLEDKAVSIQTGAVRGVHETDFLIPIDCRFIVMSPTSLQEKFEDEIETEARIEENRRKRRREEATPLPRAPQAKPPLEPAAN
jgi:hypothetical protein